MRFPAYAALIAQVAALLSSGVALPAQAPSIEDPEALFQQIKTRISEHLARLPNYTCHETIDRMIRLQGSYRQLDRVELEVAFIGREELFSPPGEDRFGEQPLVKLVSGGTIGNGAMGSPIDLIFARSVAEFKFAGAGKKDGHKTFRFDLRVPMEKGDFRIRHNGSVGMAGYDGSVWVDAETLDLVRVDLKVNKIPSYLKVELIEESLHYKKLTIGNSEFSLPDRSTLSATDAMGTYTLNAIKLDRCREYAAESVVKYNPPSQAQGTADRQR